MKDLRDIKPGDWLFTCRMEPVQFGSWDEKNPEDYYEIEEFNKRTDEEKFNFCHSDFSTFDGSSHSVCGCGLSPISEKYAKWFIENKVWEIYEKHDNREGKPVVGEDHTEFNTITWELYEKDVRKLCEEHNINYEGC